MSDAIDVEATPAQAVAVRQNNMAVGQAMGVNEILAQVTLIQDVMRKVMKEGEHFGTIPGCGDKKTLLQPGAQKLMLTFRLAPEYQIQETDLPRGHKEFRIVCTIKSITSGAFVGQGVGCCSSMESKYRFRGGARKCPQCHKETIIKGKAEYGGGWLCFAKKGGCGAKWPDGSQEIEGQSIERVENDNPADTFNTVLKIAKKRAFVDATITATAASDIFTQDVGDDEEPQAGKAPEPSKMPQDEKGGIKVAPVSQASTPPVAVKPTKPTIDAATPETRLKLIESMADFAKPALEYFQKVGYLLPNESLTDLPLRFVPVTRKQFEALKLAIVAFTEGDEAKPAFPPNAEGPPTTPAKPVEVPRAAATATPELIEAWRTYPMPWGKEAGVLLGELDKKYLYGLWANVKVETEYNGKPKKPETIAKDELFRRMLDDAGAHYGFQTK